MRHPKVLFLVTILNVLFAVLPGGCNRIPTLPDNCTCKTSHGTYSLFPLRRTDGKPRFSESGFPPHEDYTYAYNPCVPFTMTSRKGNCTNVALCKYDTNGDPPVYSDIGEQRDVECDISDGKISLIYPVQNRKIPTHESKVILKCSNNSLADSKFSLADEADMIFTLTSICGCPNRCLPTTPTPGPLSTKPSTIPSRPSTIPSKPSTIPSSGHTAKNWYSKWELVILLPSLGAFVVMVICFVCLWRRLSVIQKTLMCRCCLCCDFNDPGREERIATETSWLIDNQADNRAIEHEDAMGEGKIKEPVQVEDKDVEEDHKFHGKSDKTVVV